jgi:hypothetical protein
MTQPPPDRLILRRDAVGQGWTDDELARLVRAGAWTRLGRGAYVEGGLPGDAGARHRLLVRATLARLGTAAVVSHQSAAVLHGLPLWGARLGEVHVTRQPPAWNDSRGRLRVHVARLRDDEVTVIDGSPVTSPVRTALDLARALPFEAAVVVLDAALHRRQIGHEQLTERLFDIAGTRGSRAAARAVRFADARSESVGESRSRVLPHRLQLAPSALQFEVLTGEGLFLGRTDFAWEEQRVLGEFDGRVKYGRLLRPGQEPGDVVFDEKRREDALRAEDWSVVRWTWADIESPGRLSRWLQRALGRSHRPTTHR